MPASCPECGSRFLHVSHRVSWKERLDLFGFSRHLRCKDCRTRFVAKTFYWRDLLFAKCPRCKRMDLNQWFEQHYHAHGWAAIKLSLGGHRFRCEYCRINFVSFRSRKERFTFKRWTKRKALHQMGSGSAAEKPEEPATPS